MNIFLYFIGLFLLYLPPLIAYWFPNPINNVLKKIRLDTIFMVSTSISFTLLMFYLMPGVPIFVFSFYMITFNLIYLLYKKMFCDKGEAFRVAIYVCFAISVLWEWPIQIMITQNDVALALSSFKALGIPFLYITLRNRGYKPEKKHYLFLSLIIIEGLFLIYNLTYLSVENIYLNLHLYRIYWLILFIYLITVTYINHKSIQNKPMNQELIL